MVAVSCVALVLSATTLTTLVPVWPAAAFAQERGAATTGAAATSAEELVPARRSFIPLRDLQTLVERDRQGVLLPRSEFDALLKKAAAADAAVPPAAQVLGTTRYAATISGDQLLLTVTAELEHLTGEWKIWKFPLQRLGVERALVNDQPAIIGRTNDNALTVVTHKPGTHRLTLDFSTELVTVGSDRVAGCSLLPGAVGEFTLTVEAGKRLLVDGAELQRPTPIAEPAEYRIAVGGKMQIQLRITDRSDERSADAVTLATSGYGLIVAPGEVTWRALTTLQVSGRPIDRLTLTVPKSLEITDVTSTGLEAWELSDDAENPQQLTISLAYGQPFEGTRTIAVRGVMAVPTGTAWSVPPLKIANVTSHIGQIVIQHAAGIRLQVLESEGVRRAIDAERPVSDMPDDMPTGPAQQRMRFDAWREEFGLRLTVAPREQELAAAIATVLQISSNGIELQAALTVTPRFAPLFELDVDIPAEWQVLEAKGSDQQRLSWRLLPQQPGTNRVRIPLASALAAGAKTTLTLSLTREVEGWPVEQEPIVFPLPELVTPQANVVETAIVVRGDEDLELTAADVTGLDSAPLRAEWERLRFQSQDTRYSAQLKVARRPALTAVETAGFYLLDRHELVGLVYGIVTVEGGGIRELLLRLPEPVSDLLEFKVVGATLIEQTQLGVQNGQRIWRLKFAQRVLGTLQLSMLFTQARESDDAAIDCPLLEVVNADRTHGAVVIQARHDQRMVMTAVDAAGVPLLEIDPLDLPLVPGSLGERIVAVFRTIGDGNRVTLKEQRFEKAALPSAICTQLDILTVLARTGELQQRAEFALRLAGVQQLQVALPESTDLWAATLDGAPVEIRRAEGKLLMALPQSAQGEVSATLQLFYRSATTALRHSGTLLETPPVIGVVAGDGSLQPVDVLSQNWELVHPQDTLIIHSSSALEPKQRLDTPSWLPRLVALPTSGETVGGLVLLVVICGVLLLSLYVRQGLTLTAQRVLEIFMVGVIGMVLIALLLPSVQQSREAARRTELRNMQRMAEMDALMAREGFTTGTVAGLVASGEDVSETFEMEVNLPAPAESMNQVPAAKPESKADMDGLRRATPQETLKEQRILVGERDLRLESKPGMTTIPVSPKGSAPSAPASRPRSSAAATPADPFADGAPASGKEPMGGDKKLNDFVAPFDDNGLALGDRFGRPAEQAMPAAVGGPGGPAGGAAAGRQSGSATPLRRGLLSLALTLDRPAGSVDKKFQYVGGSGTGTGVPLQVDYLDRRGGAALRGFLFAVGLLLGWWLRLAPCATKCTLCVIGLAVGGGLVAVAPVTWQTPLDGVLFGVLGLVVAWTLWGLGQSLRNCCTGCCRILGLLFLAGLVASASPATAAAQQPASQPQAQPAQQRASAVPPAANTNPSPATPNPEASQRIVIPPPPVFPPSQLLIYENLNAPLEADRVFLPFAKFVELYQRAHPDQRPQTPAPITAKLVSALYDVKLAPVVDGQERAAVVAARLTILSHVDGQQPVDLPFSNVLLKSAVLNDRPAALVTAKAPWTVLIPAPGLQVLDLEFEVPIIGNDTAGSLGLKLSATPAAKLAFTLPTATHTVRVNGSTSLYRRVTQNDQARIELPVDAGGELQIAWQPEQARAGAAVIHVESTTAVTIADAGVSASVGFQYRVRQGIIRDVTFQLPEGLQLQTVSGPDVGGWELVGAAAERKLRVFLRRNVNDATQLTLDGFLGQQVDQEFAFPVPEVAPLEITTEAGTVAVYAADVFTLRSDNVTNLNQIDAASFQSPIPVSRLQVPAQLAFRFSRRPWTLELRGNRLATQLRANLEQAVTIGLRKNRVTARIQCELLRMPRSSLMLRVPENWLVLDVQAGGLADWYRVAAAGNGPPALQLDFDRPQQGRIEIVLLATESRNPTESAVRIGGIEVLDAERQSSQLAVWLQAGLTATVADLGNWQPRDVTSISGSLRQLTRLPADFAFQSPATSPAEVQLTLTRLEPQLAASSLTVITVTDVALVYGFVFQWKIDRAATETLSVELPSRLTRRLQFHAPEIREAVPTTIDDQTTRWTIHLREPRSQTFRIAATASLPPVSDVIPAPAIRFITESVGGVNTVTPQQHYVLLVNTSLSQLRAVNPSLVEPVQRDDVDFVVRQELVDQATEFVRLKATGVPPSWTLQRFAPAANVPAAVNLADLVTIVSRDGSYRAMSTYTIKNRNRQFLALRLPENSRLMSVLVFDHPSRAVLTTVNNQPTYLIALPKGSAVDLSFPIRVIYSGRLAKPLPARGSLLPADLDLPSSTVVSQDESAEFGIPVARTQWTVHLPDDYQVRPVRDVQRHNLNQPRDRDAAISESLVSVLMRDAEELLSTVDSLSGISSRVEALDNLKQLEKSLSGLQNQSYARPTAEQAKQAERLQASVQKLERSLDAADEFEMLDADQDNVITQEMLGRQLREVTGNTSDTRAQLGRAFINNGVVIADNYNMSDGTTLDGEQLLMFSLSAASPSSANRAKDASGLVQQNTLEARQQYQQFNEDQLSNLNARFADEKRSRVNQDLEESFRQSGQRFRIESESGTVLGIMPPPSGPNFSPAMPVEIDFEIHISQAQRGAVMGGGLGGGMGGMGGMGAVGDMGLPLVGENAHGWTWAGGLSLPFDLPTAGQKLVFTKTGGDARLAVRLQTVDSLYQGLGIVWALVCLVLMVVAMQRPAAWAALKPWLTFSIVLISAAGFLCLMQPLSILSLAVFTVATGVLVWQQKSTAPASPGGTP